MAGLLQGKVTLIAGGSFGIGFSCAEIMAREGAKVVVAARGEKLGREAVAAIRKAGGEATFVRCDVADEAQVKAMVEAAVKTYGRLDCAVNNAGHGGERKLIADVSIEDFDSIMNVNLRGMFFCMKYELIRMLENGGGAIVNMSSANGIIGTPLFTAYTASKHGVNGLTKSAALEYAKDGIRVNALLPGGVATPLFDKIYGIETPKRQAVREGHPIGREGRPEEAGMVTAWLCSDKASYINGACVSMDAASP
ncbi:MAG: SDR family oxidoreductase, partial [SAR202 cluster bacterium]|nr:SDR family oxidoreductase [SAR202 cluster bacterium]